MLLSLKTNPYTFKPENHQERYIPNQAVCVIVFKLTNNKVIGTLLLILGARFETSQM